MNGADYFQPLQVDLIGHSIRVEHEHDIFPAHEQVIRPLLQQADSAYVYKGQDAPFFLFGRMNVTIDLSKESFLISDKGKFRFDRTQECVTGHERFWNAIAWQRGSIVIVLPPGAVDFKELFRHMYTNRPWGLLENPNTGNNPAATRLCRAEREKGHVALLFSASNGIENMCIYAQGEVWDNILRNARTVLGEFGG